LYFGNKSGFLQAIEEKDVDIEVDGHAVHDKHGKEEVTIFFFIINQYTVKPVLRGHHWDKIKVTI
jgi:hypothetical protein